MVSKSRVLFSLWLLVCIFIWKRKIQCKVRSLIWERKLLAIAITLNWGLRVSKVCCILSLYLFWDYGWLSRFGVVVTAYYNRTLVLYRVEHSWPHQCLFSSAQHFLITSSPGHIELLPVLLLLSNYRLFSGALLCQKFADKNVFCRSIRSETHYTTLPSLPSLPLLSSL